MKIKQTIPLKLTLTLETPEEIEAMSALARTNVSVPKAVKGYVEKLPNYDGTSPEQIAAHVRNFLNELDLFV